MVKIKKKYEDIKINIILVISFMMLLFTLCLIMYSEPFFRLSKMSINTNYTYPLENELALKLQSLIPYSEVTSPKYLTAYQDKDTNLTNIHNDILLYQALTNIKDSLYTSKNIENSLNNLYGTNYFISHNSFNIDGKLSCLFDNTSNIYNCSNLNTTSIIYKSLRKIKNLLINDQYILEENIIFYSEEKINDLVIYKIYENGLYQNVIKAFTNKDLEEQNTSIDNYLNTLDLYAKKYQSVFKKIDEDTYNWLGTKYLK